MRERERRARNIPLLFRNSFLRRVSFYTLLLPNNSFCRVRFFLNNYLFDFILFIKPINFNDTSIIILSINCLEELKKINKNENTETLLLLLMIWHRDVWLKNGARKRDDIKW